MSCSPSPAGSQVSGFRREFLMQTPQLAFQVEVEGEDGRAEALALTRVLGGWGRGLFLRSGYETRQTRVSPWASAPGIAFFAATTSVSAANSWSSESTPALASSGFPPPSAARPRTGRGCGPEPPGRAPGRSAGRRSIGGGRAPSGRNRNFSRDPCHSVHLHVIPLRGQDPAAMPMPPEPQTGPGGPTEVNASNGGDERLRPDGVHPAADERRNRNTIGSVRSHSGTTRDANSPGGALLPWQTTRAARC
jgi:hypothetical protein